MTTDDFLIDAIYGIRIIYNSFSGSLTSHLYACLLFLIPDNWAC